VLTILLVPTVHLQIVTKSQTVKETQGVVTLAGKVHTSEEKVLVEQNVRGVQGVVKVNNELQIVSP
jgi:osmotically-inducible protein OsmY